MNNIALGIDRYFEDYFEVVMGQDGNNEFTIELKSDIEKTTDHAASQNACRVAGRTMITPAESQLSIFTGVGAEICYCPPEEDLSEADQEQTAGGD